VSEKGKILQFPGNGNESPDGTERVQLDPHETLLINVLLGIVDKDALAQSGYNIRNVENGTSVLRVHPELANGLEIVYPLNEWTVLHRDQLKTEEQQIGSFLRLLQMEKIVQRQCSLEGEGVKSDKHIALVHEGNPGTYVIFELRPDESAIEKIYILIPPALRN
jgi:hypothetical protein